MHRFFLVAAILSIVGGSAKAEEPITLRLAIPVPPSSAFHRVLLEWSEGIAKASEARLRIQLFPGTSVADLGNVYDRVQNGVVDIGWGLQGLIGGQFAKTSVANLPGNLSTAQQCSNALWRLFADEIISDEYSVVKTLALGCWPPTVIISSKPLRRLEDIRGLRVRAGSKMLAQQIELLGGAPVTIPTSEIYQGLQRGMIDAATTGWSGALTFKLQEVSKFGLEAPLGNATNFLVMNKRSYARLPEDMRYVLETKIGGPLSAKMGAAANEEEKLGEEAIRKVANFNVATVPDADMANLVDSMRPLVDEWVKRTPEGAKVLAAYHQEAGQK